MEKTEYYEIWQRVIELYRERPFMWDKNHKRYFNRGMRMQAFKLMYNVYLELEPTMDFARFRKRFENMKTAFVRELKKVKASKLSESDGEDVYTPTLWYYNLFSFLTESDDQTQTEIETYEREDENSEDYDMKPIIAHSIDQDEYGAEYFEASPSFPSQSISQLTNEAEEPAPPKKPRLSFQKKQEKFLDVAQQLISVKKDDWEVIGKSIGIQLKDMTRHQQIIAQKLISDAIFYGKLEKLTEESSVSLGNCDS